MQIYLFFFTKNGLSEKEGGNTLGEKRSFKFVMVLVFL